MFYYSTDLRSDSQFYHTNVQMFQNTWQASEKQAEDTEETIMKFINKKIKIILLAMRVITGFDMLWPEACS